ncbi:MAG: hypothetical protein A2284_03230 [Deltaproteobacteria bacterium RIFOXYA12_FULL_61_11]|nr:MAG: hypothetical protein A2284_03230 [Deltaproteobacteria bacterium RIFOXYA12_FULL_61_11]
MPRPRERHLLASLFLLVALADCSETSVPVDEEPSTAIVSPITPTRPTLPGPTEASDPDSDDPLMPVPADNSPEEDPSNQQNPGTEPPEPTNDTTLPPLNERVLLLVDTADHAALETSLETYRQDVLSRYPAVELTLRHDGDFLRHTAAQLRDVLLEEYREPGLRGVILVGAFPFRLWEQGPLDQRQTGLNPLYYEDLDGFWKDVDGNGIDDFHGEGPSEGPELFVAWLPAPASTRIEALTAFFAKTHDYATGQLAFRKRGLLAATAAAPTSVLDDYRAALTALYGSSLDLLTATSAVTLTTYQEGLAKRYESAVLHPDDDTLAYLRHDLGDSNLYATALRSLDGGSIVTILAGGLAGGLHKTTTTTVAASYLFGTSITQAVLASTLPTPLVGGVQVLEELGTGTYLGQAWQETFSDFLRQDNLLRRYGADFDRTTWLPGSILLGDPFTTLQR